jgi:preprotein translocase subunit YajC
LYTFVEYNLMGSMRYELERKVLKMPAQTAALLGQILPFVVLIAVFYFFIIRPQQKRDKKIKEMLAALKVGDRITTIGGIYGRITNIKDDVITLEVGVDKIKLVIARWAIRSVEDSDVENEMK